MKELGLMLPEETNGKCPNCKSSNIKEIERCETCGYTTKECLVCHVRWQEFLSTT